MVPEPFYTNYNGFATMAGINLVPITTYAEDGFALPDNSTIEAKITNKTQKSQPKINHKISYITSIYLL